MKFKSTQDYTICKEVELGGLGYTKRIIIIKQTWFNIYENKSGPEEEGDLCTKKHYIGSKV